MGSLVAALVELDEATPCRLIQGVNAAPKPVISFLLLLVTFIILPGLTLTR